MANYEYNWQRYVRFFFFFFGKVEEEHEQHHLLRVPSQINVAQNFNHTDCCGRPTNPSGFAFHNFPQQNAGAGNDTSISMPVHLRSVSFC